MTDQPSPLMDKMQAAAYLRMKEETLQYYRTHRKGPPYIKNGRFVFYLQKDLDEYLETLRKNPISQTA